MSGGRGLRLKIPSVDLKNKAAQVGYLKCGVIPADISDEYNRQLDERAGKFPKSKALYESLYNRPPENAKSIIVCTLNYAKYKMPDIIQEGLIGKCYLFDCRMPYAYENRAKAEFETYIKTLGIGILNGYVPARLAAAKAGVGKFGRNNFIYDSECGSYIWIDTWFVDAELEYDAVEDDYLLPECSDNCLKCAEACPTGALYGSMAMDRGLCVTHLMSSAKGALDGAMRERMGTWIYGCDACQDACPANANKRTGAENFPLLAEHAEYMQPERILEMGDSVYENVVNPRFWYLGKDGMWLWKCNALRSMINSGDDKYHKIIKNCLEHEDERIREVAQWGCDKLGI